MACARAPRAHHTRERQPFFESNSTIRPSCWQWTGWTHFPWRWERSCCRSEWENVEMICVANLFECPKGNVHCMRIAAQTLHQMISSFSNCWSKSDYIEIAPIRKSPGSVITEISNALAKTALIMKFQSSVKQLSEAIKHEADYYRKGRHKRQSLRIQR